MWGHEGGLMPADLASGVPFCLAANLTDVLEDGTLYQAASGKLRCQHFQIDARSILTM